MDIQEGLIKLWTWSGLVEQKTGSWYENKVLGKFISATMPTLTLDHLYKYAILKLQKEGKYIRLNAFADGVFNAMINSDEDDLLLATVFADTPTEALYQAIMKVIDNEKEK